MARLPARAVPVLLLVVFLVVPAAEIYVLIQVGQAIGALATVALLVADAVLGTVLFRREGRRAWQALRTAIGRGAVPGREVADGALVVLGGALLVSPGFVTDLVGVLCLLPPTRAVLRRLLTGFVTRRLLPPLAPRGGAGSRRVVEGEVVEGDEPAG